MVVVWDGLTGERKRTLTVPDRAAVDALAVSNDARRIVSVHATGNLLVWETGSGRVLHRWQTRGIVTAVTLSPDSKLVVTVGNDVRFWQPDRNDPLLIIQRRGGTVRAVAMDGGGNILATGGDDRTAYLLNLRQLRKRLRELQLDW